MRRRLRRLSTLYRNFLANCLELDFGLLTLLLGAQELLLRKLDMTLVSLDLFFHLRKLLLCILKPRMCRKLLVDKFLQRSNLLVRPSFVLLVFGLLLHPTIISNALFDVRGIR